MTKKEKEMHDQIDLLTWKLKARDVELNNLTELTVDLKYLYADATTQNNRLKARLEELEYPKTK